MQIFLHRACWAEKRGDKIDLLSLETTYCGPCLPIFKNISYNGKLQNLQKSSSWARIKYDGNFALNFAVWQQPLRFFKAEIYICAFLRGFGRVCRVLCLVCVNVSVLNVSSCYVNPSIGVKGEELKQIRTKLQKIGCNCTEQRVALPRKNGRDFTSTSGDDTIKTLFSSHLARMGAFRPLILWTFPWKYDSQTLRTWFCNFTPLLPRSFCLVWQILARFDERGSQSKKSQIFGNAEGPADFYIRNTFVEKHINTAIYI